MVADEGLGLYVLLAVTAVFPCLLMIGLPNMRPSSPAPASSYEQDRADGERYIPLKEDRRRMAETIDRKSRFRNERPCPILTVRIDIPKFAKK